MSEIVVRPFRPADLPALKDLHRLAYGSELVEELWSWKYDRSPFRHLGVVGEKDGSVVAYYGGWVWRIRGAGRAFEAIAFNDTMTDPAVRMAGRHPALVPLHESALRLAREQGIGFFCGFPNARAARFGARFLGYRYERLLRLTAPAASFPAPASPAVRVGQTFDAAHDRLTERVHALPGFRIERSAEVLNWRYHARPDRYYRVYETAGEGGDGAYAVVSTVGELALLVDLQAPGGPGTPALPALLGAIAADLAPHGVTLLKTAVSKGSALGGRLAGELAFAAEEDESPFGIEPTAPVESREVTAATFDVRWGDMDVY